MTPYFGATAQASRTFKSTATTQTITALTNTKTYTFKVAAGNASGTGPKSVATAPVTVGTPIAPTGLTRSAGSGQATVHWIASAKNNGSGINGYLVTPYLGTVAQTVRTFSGAATTRTITGLTNTKTYTFKVAARNARGVGPRSIASPPLVIGAPSAPIGATATAASTQATVHWTAPATNNGSAVSGYVVWPYLGGAAQAPRTFNSAVTTQLIGSLTNGKTYTFRVAAKNARGTGVQSSGSNGVTPTAPTGEPGISVSGNHLVDGGGNVLQLRGVNRPGPEYAAVEGWGIFDGPTNDDASIAHIKSWKVNAVRVPLNEDSWLGINGVSPTYNGAPYRAAILDYVNRLTANGLVAIINLHFSAPGTMVPDDQSPMADADHSPAFWQSVATTFKSNHFVIFDVFNEPYPNNNQNTTAAWTCIRDGGMCSGVSYSTAGMQQLVNVIRATGATQPLMIAGPEYAGDLDRWLTYAPTDPLHQLIASVHIYGLPLDSPYRVSSTWNQYIAPVATHVPVVIGEFGDTDCTSDFSPPLMSWADAHGVSYLAWAWVTSDCAGDPALITDYNGTPTAYGVGVRNHLLAVP